MNSLADPSMQALQVGEPDVSGDLIAGLSPNAFLGIKRRLVRRKIFQMKLGGALHKKVNRISSMPSGSVYIEPDLVTRESCQHVVQGFQESLRISSVCSHQSLFS